MPTCRCPKCCNLLSIDSSKFGQEFICDHCAHGFAVDTVHIARFEFPDRIDIHVSWVNGDSWASKPATLLIRRGFPWPPLLTGPDGILVVTSEMFHRALEEEFDGMDPSDVSQIRYVDVQLPTRAAAAEMAARRRASGWGITRFERQLYGTMQRLLEAYTIGALAREHSVQQRVDLAAGNRNVTVKLQG